MTAPIVLGIDDDDQVALLVDRAAQLAGERHTSVVVVHVVHRREVWVLASMMLDSTRYLHERGRRVERSVLVPLRARGIDARLVVRLGEPAHELAHVAALVGADLIVIGAESHARKHHLTGGRVAHRLERLTAVQLDVVEAAGHGTRTSGGH